MPYRWEDRTKVKSGIATLGLWGHIAFWLGYPFALLGIIGDAAGVKVGLSATSWLLLSIAAFASAIVCFIGWGVCWYLSVQEQGK
jgi:hypothetical protein